MQLLRALGVKCDTDTTTELTPGQKFRSWCVEWCLHHGAAVGLTLTRMLAPMLTPLLLHSRECLPGLGAQRAAC